MYFSGHLGSFSNKFHIFLSESESTVEIKYKRTLIYNSLVRNFLGLIDNLLNGS